MPLNFALNSDLHPKSAPTTLSCVSGGCLLVLYFRGAGLTLCAGPDVTLPGGIPWPGCRKMFLRTQREIQSWKPGQHCLRGIPFPGRKAGTGEGRLPILYDWEQEGDIFTSRKVWWSLSCFLSPAYMDKCGCEVVTVRISGEKLGNEAFSRILEALCIVLISFWRSLEGSASPWR